MSVAAKLSDLADKMPEANLQAQINYGGQRKKIVPLPTCHHGPPAWRPLSSHPNARYCLEIHVNLTEELGALPQPSHSWMASLEEDMLQEARTGFTEAVVIGPGRAVHFYGRHSMGEGLKADEGRDVAFLIAGAGTWVGKAAYLTADPMTIQEGKRTIPQAVSDNRVKVRGLGHPHVNPLAKQPFQFDAQGGSPLKDVSGDCSSDYP